MKMQLLNKPDSTTVHTHAIYLLKAKFRDYNVPRCVAVVDYEKPFDSVQPKQ